MCSIPRPGSRISNLNYIYNNIICVCTRTNNQYYNLLTPVDYAQAVQCIIVIDIEFDFILNQNV